MNTKCHKCTSTVKAEPKNPHLHRWQQAIFAKGFLGLDQQFCWWR